jgi:hypothetical protein
MPAIIEFPTLGQYAVEQFGAVFVNAPERRHFAEYLTGLLVAEKKTVSGMNAEFAQTTDQSCLNRWITEVKWDADQLNQQRLARLQETSQTRYAPSGVIPIDNTLGYLMVLEKPHQMLPHTQHPSDLHQRTPPLGFQPKLLVSLQKSLLVISL